MGEKTLEENLFEVVYKCRFVFVVAESAIIRIFITTERHCRPKE
jgi:hypothetical protein